MSLIRSLTLCGSVPDFVPFADTTSLSVPCVHAYTVLLNSRPFVCPFERCVSLVMSLFWLSWAFLLMSCPFSSSSCATIGSLSVLVVLRFSVKRLCSLNVFHHVVIIIVCIGPSMPPNMIHMSPTTSVHILYC